MTAEASRYRTPERRIPAGALITIWELKKKGHNKHNQPDTHLPPLPPIGKTPKPEVHPGPTPKKHHKSGNEHRFLGKHRSSRRVH